MTRPRTLTLTLATLLVTGVLLPAPEPARAQTAAPAAAGSPAVVSDSAEFARWHRANLQDLEQLHQKFVALARAIPAARLGWTPMEGTRSAHDVLAHVAAEGWIEGTSFGRPLPSGSLADFDAEEARLRALPDDQLITAMDQALASLRTGFASLRLQQVNTPVPYFGRAMLPRVIALYTLMDLHEHLGQLVAYARMNQIVPPWSRTQ